MSDNQNAEQEFISSGSPALDNFWRKHGVRFNELLCVGGTNPTSYGCITGGGLYGRVGLEQNEFFESIQLIAYVDGMMSVLGESQWIWMKNKLREETERQETERQRR